NVLGVRVVRAAAGHKVPSRREGPGQATARMRPPVKRGIESFPVALPGSTAPIPIGRRYSDDGRLAIASTLRGRMSGDRSPAAQGRGWGGLDCGRDDLCGWVPHFDVLPL